VIQDGTDEALGGGRKLGVDFYLKGGKTSAMRLLGASGEGALSLSPAS